MNRVAHNERCKDCKVRVLSLLEAAYGTVKTNWDLNISSRLDDHKNSESFGDLQKIYSALVGYRGFDNFVKSNKLPRVDFFVPSMGMIVEFDESQHFTIPRDISLSLYPAKLEPGYSIQRWRTLCQHLNKRDNDPPYRDEQRAWYDTLRDFAPSILGSGNIVRLYSRDRIWCDIDLDRNTDIDNFKAILSREGGRL